VVSVPAGTLCANELPESDDPETVPRGESGQPLSLKTAQRLCCDGSVIPMIEDADGNPLNIGRKTRIVSPALRRAVDRRDNGCRYPGCTTTRHIDAHHIKHWAHGGETKLSNLISLCRRHHTWLHEGGYRIDVDEHGAYFVDPMQRRIEAVGDTRSRGNVQTLIETNSKAGIKIKPDTTECSWDGQSANYHHIMANVFQGSTVQSLSG
jgi:hypothetical protein